MIDISKGLSHDLLQICASSNVGCKIYYHKIPIADATMEAAEEFHLEPVVIALNGGDDYELLFTIPVKDYDKILNNEDISIIGYVTDREHGCFMETGNGERIEINSFQ